ncbi:50S ribosomal protein L24 [candidate division WS5 bacterium]|uniref:Large ribosomal subunit protein uL24 n=1 Tax=candidate division WS5 bacterium TaxID=2093353 RepID=A0A419DA62_9BACT|nr:MAG: 50S ribosomal protein L24 [candidate division WS5 bacterium]
MKTKVKIKKGDKVYVLTGKDRGKTGIVSNVFSKESKAVVEGVNVVKKTVKGSQKNPQGGIVEKASPIDMSNIQVICPGCNKSARLGFKVLKDGKKERICKKCGREIRQ